MLRRVPPVCAKPRLQKALRRAGDSAKADASEGMWRAMGFSPWGFHLTTLNRFYYFMDVPIGRCGA